MSSLLNALLGKLKKISDESDNPLNKLDDKDLTRALILGVCLLIGITLTLIVLAVLVKAFFWPVVIAVLAYFAVRLYLK